MPTEPAASAAEPRPQAGSPHVVDRRRVRYRTAEDHILAAAKLLGVTPGDREVDELLGMAMAKLMARGRRE